MLKRSMKRFMAGLLCGVLLCVNTGTEQAVYAAPAAEIAEGSEAVKPEGQESVEPAKSEGQEPAESGEQEPSESEKQEPAESEESGATGAESPGASDEGEAPASGEEPEEEPAGEQESGGTKAVDDSGEELPDAADTASEEAAGDFTINADGVLTAYTGSDTEIIIPDTVTAIGNGVFSGRTDLKNVALPYGLTKIGDNAFKDCSALESITIPDSVKSIGNSAFYNCSGLSGDLVIPDSVNEVKSYAFYGCSGFDGTLTLSDEMTAVANHTFNGCTRFTGILEIPDSIKTVGYGAFYDCKAISGVVFGAGVTRIYVDYSSNAFKNCPGVETVTFLGKEPPIVNNSNLSTVSYSEQVSRLFGSDGFSGLTTIYVPAGSYGVYSSAYGDFLQTKTRIKVKNTEEFIIENHVLVAYIGDDAEVTVPADVKKIGNHAFLNNTTLK